MDPVSMLVTGVATVAGSVVKAKASKMEGEAQAQNALQDALAIGQQAGAQRLDAESMRQDAETTRLSASLIEDEALASDYNAGVNLLNASQIRAQYSENERRYRYNAAKERGVIKGAVAASGRQMTGSALDLLAEATANQELDALTIRHEGNVAAIAEENNAKLNQLRAASARKNVAGVLKQADFIETKADFADESAKFLDRKAGAVAGTAGKLRKAGTLKAVGDLASGATTLFSRMG